MHPTSFRRAALSAALALAAPSLWALPSQYHVTDLGALSIGNQITSKGKVAGIDASHFVIKAAVFVHGKPHEFTNPFPEGIVHGLDDAGVAVGEIGDPSIRHAAVWRGANQLLDLGRLLVTDHSVATAINSNGDCTVDGEFAGANHSFIIPGCDGIQLLINIGSLGGAQTFTTALNDSREVTGESALPGAAPLQGMHAFLFSQGAMHDLGVLEGDNESQGMGLNNLGHVVGSSQRDSNHARAFFFDGLGAMKAIGSFGGTVSQAFGVNDDDVVVGMAADSLNKSHAFVIDEKNGGLLLDLQTMLDASGDDFVLAQALGINDAGQILASGFGPTDSFPRAVVLTPND
jgi:probable HAF family extracellular repeat protein